MFIAFAIFYLNLQAYCVCFLNGESWVWVFFFFCLLNYKEVHFSKPDGDMYVGKNMI